ncbi:MAG: hypothetical protein K2N64_06015 [Anaeroplasmataceae bacterium]|nr:hypothetical protein [Anaeroplasmataceae bacterium]
MPKLTLWFKGYSSLQPILFINDREIMLKKKNGKLYAKADCDSLVNIKILNHHPLQSNFGLLLCYFFFIISLFGILDKRYPYKNKSILFNANLTIKRDMEINLKFCSFSPDKPAIEMVGIEDAHILENKYYFDEKVKRKMKLLKWLKIVTWILLIPLTFLIVYKIIN